MFDRVFIEDLESRGSQWGLSFERNPDDADLVDILVNGERSATVRPGSEFPTLELVPGSLFRVPNDVHLQGVLLP